jgi:prepilin-type N-terminal cleavage/methylation domain-containing protein
MRRNRGFSLIELLIVVAIILIIAAIAIPNLIRSRVAANEASAVYSLRTIHTAQTTYALTFPNVGYADDLGKLGGVNPNPPTPAAAGILDWLLGCASQPCTKSGYNFYISSTVGVPVANYTANGQPISVGQSGIRGFCVDASGIIKADPSGGTTCTVTIQ